MLPLKECDVVALIKKYRTFLTDEVDDEGNILAGHNLLSETHTDTLPGTVTRGDLVVGQGTTAVWTRLPIGTNGLVLTSDGLDVYWGTPSGGAVHNLLSVTHPDTTAAAVVRGDLITGQGSTATWTRLAIGTTGYVLTSDGVDAYWATPASVTVHNLLSATHPDTTAASVVRGDIIVGIGSTPTWQRYAIQIPTATHVNYLATYSTDVEPSWKALFDDLAPASITIAATGAAGTSLYAAHRDHVHGSPATWTAAAHNLLSVIHGDTTAASVVQGDIIVGQTASPSTTWKRYAISVPGSGNLNVLGVGYSEVEPTWKTLFDNTLPSTITVGATSAPGSEIIAARRDHVHGSPATWPAVPHYLLGTPEHIDTEYSEIVQGDIIVRGPTKWGNRSFPPPSAGQSITLQVRYADLEPHWYTSFTDTLPTSITSGASSSTGTSMFFSRSDHTHGATGIAASPHILLSGTHSDTTPASVQRGDLIVGKGYVTYWERMAISIPASNYLNILAVTSTAMEPAWWSVFTATTPSTITAGSAGSAGTSTYASRQDHSHPAPSTWAATAHNLLSATHGDTTAASIQRGDIIVGIGLIPKWTSLSFSSSPENYLTLLGQAYGELEPTWKSLFNLADPTSITIGASASSGTSIKAARIDHTHASPSTWTPTAHTLTGSSHTESGLTTGHFLKATGATTFGFAAHGLTYSDLGAHGVSANYLARATSTTAFGNSLIRDDGTYIGIGKAGTCLLDVNGQINGTSMTTGTFYSTGIADSGSSIALTASSFITLAATSYIQVSSDTWIHIQGGSSAIQVKNGWVHTGTAGEGSYNSHIHITDNGVEYVIPCKVPA